MSDPHQMTEADLARLRHDWDVIEQERNRTPEQKLTYRAWRSAQELSKAAEAACESARNVYIAALNTATE